MERRSGLVFLFLLSFLCSSTVFAQLSKQVVESFNTTSNLSSTTAVWNTVRGDIHPPIFVDNYDAGAGAVDLAVDVGDGSNGAMTTVGDFSRFGSVVGTTINIDTDTYSELQVTNLTIPSGYTLTSTGSNPIIFKVLGSVTIDGDIDCSGTAGTSGGIGGTAFCGAGAGGATATNGTIGGALVTGGDAGPAATVNSGQGGGGGGAYIKPFGIVPDKPDGTAGSALVPGTGGAVGNRQRDDAFVLDLNGAGSGGGGGSSYATDGSTGAGGGAGGGAIHIYAVGDITINGSVLANGGDGGDVTGGLLAGAGGGGGGGSILMISAGDIQNNGTVNALAGNGGTGGAGATNGGNGFFGRTWLVEKDGFASGNLEDPDTQLNSPGDVRFETTVSYTTTSGVIDLGNTDPTITSLPINIANLGGATLTYEAAFGTSPSDPNLSVFAPVAGYIGAKNGRYAAFRIQLDNTNAATPATVTDLSFIYDGNKVEDFDFVGSCGSATGGANPPWSAAILFMPLIFLLRFRLYQSQP